MTDQQSPAGAESGQGQQQGQNDQQGQQGPQDDDRPLSEQLLPRVQELNAQSEHRWGRAR
jgi:hypothetical protein